MNSVAEPEVNRVSECAVQKANEGQTEGVLGDPAKQKSSGNRKAKTADAFLFF